MPAHNPFDDSGGPRSLTVLFWLGVGMAPIAALMLLVAEGSATLRIGAVLALLATVLIALSSALRDGGGSGRPDLAESLAGQRAEIRGEVRTEVAAGVQATHRAVAERLRPLRDDIEALRGHVDAIWAGTAGPGHRPDGGHTSLAASHSATAPGDRPPFSYRDEHEPAAVRIGVAAVPQPASSRPRASSGRAAVPPAGGASRPQVPTGIVRHTETVRVTTRQTIVEPDGGRSDSAHGSGYYGAAAGRAVPAQRRRSPDREPDQAAGGHQEEFAAEPDGSGGNNGAAPAGARAHDRWATVRNEGGGREVRMRRRRAQVRAHETGTEMRFEDRWAEVREVTPDRPEAHRGTRRSVGSWQQDEHGPYPADPDEAGDQADPDRRSRWAGADDIRDRGRGGGDPGDRWAEADGRGERPDHGAEPADRGRNSGYRDDVVWDDERWDEQRRDDQAWNDSDQGWSDPGWGDNAQGPDGRAPLEPARGQRVPAALTAGRATVNSWQPAWEEPERQPVGRGQRYRDDSEGYAFPPSRGVRAGGRQFGFERSDSRWG